MEHNPNSFSEISYQPTFLSNQMIPSMFTNEFLFDETTSSKGFIQNPNQYLQTGMISSFDLSIPSSIPSYGCTYGNSHATNPDVVNSMVNTRGYPQEFFHNNFSSDPQYFSSGKILQNQNQTFLTHGIPMATKSDLQDEFSCITIDDGFGNSVDSCHKGLAQTEINKEVSEKSNGTRGKWSNREDRKLLRLVTKHGERDWTTIAQKMGSRIGKQCRERWNNHLRKDIKKNEWTEEEDRALVEAHRKHQNKWVEISKEIPGRSENSVKNRWNNIKRREFSRTRPRKHRHSPSSAVLSEYIRSLMVSNHHSHVNVAGTSIWPNQVAPNHPSYVDMLAASIWPNQVVPNQVVPLPCMNVDMPIWPDQVGDVVPVPETGSDVGGNSSNFTNVPDNACTFDDQLLFRLNEGDVDTAMPSCHAVSEPCLPEWIDLGWLDMFPGNFEI